MSRGKQRALDAQAVNRGEVIFVPTAEVYRVKSDGGPSWYKVTRMPGTPPRWECTCVAGQHGTPCKHIRRAKLMRNRTKKS